MTGSIVPLDAFEPMAVCTTYPKLTFSLQVGVRSRVNCGACSVSWDKLERFRDQEWIPHRDLRLPVKAGGFCFSEGCSRSKHQLNPPRRS